MEKQVSVGFLNGHVRVAMLVLWAITITLGMAVLLRYANTPGLPAHPPATWPLGSPLRLSAQRSTLVAFIHPQCPCSRATIGELARIIACCRNRVETTVFFYVAPGTPSSWAQSDLWKAATKIPTVRVLADRNGQAARFFGARTSGQVLLYDAPGRLRFSGGITASRGHSGDNDGADSIVSWLQGKPSKRSSTPVFGCALVEEL
jgi:hypothetical protein